MRIHRDVTTLASCHMFWRESDSFIVSDIFPLNAEFYKIFIIYSAIPILAIFIREFYSVVLYVNAYIRDNIISQCIWSNNSRGISYLQMKFTRFKVLQYIGLLFLKWLIYIKTMHILSGGIWNLLTRVTVLLPNVCLHLAMAVTKCMIRAAICLGLYHITSR